jgi:hypothetical protein
MKGGKGRKVMGEEIAKEKSEKGRSILDFVGKC